MILIFLTILIPNEGRWGGERERERERKRNNGADTSPNVAPAKVVREEEHNVRLARLLGLCQQRRRPQGEQEDQGGDSDHATPLHRDAGTCLSCKECGTLSLFINDESWWRRRRSLGPRLGSANDCHRLVTTTLRFVA